jgi:hypothetical protein
MENRAQFSADFQNASNKYKKNEIYNNMEKTSLSLRKKINNKAKKYILPSSLSNDLTYEIKIPELEQKIKGHQLYINFTLSKNEEESLDILSQMLVVDNNDDIVKFSLANLKKFLIDIDEKYFNEKNLSTRFNDNLINFLYKLLINKANDFYILSNICFILNKLPILIKEDNGFYYYNILFENFDKVLKLAQAINSDEPQVKNLLYFLSIKIFLAPEEFIYKLEKSFPIYIQQVHYEIIKLEDNKFVKNMILISTLLNIINECFYYKIYSDYFFGPFQNDVNEMNADNIFKIIQKLLNFSYQMDIFEQELRCIQNFLYLFMENEKYLQNLNLKKKVQNIIKNLHLEEKIIPLIYDSTINEPGLRVIALQILINATFICTKKFCEELIDNDISTQIIKLEQYLIDQMQLTIRTKHIYGLLMDLIYNLIENESVEIIDNLSIENRCISLLFQLQKVPFYQNENKNYMIKIFNVLIQSNHKYIQTLLISEGICEWYKTILEDAPNGENISIIITNFITMVKYSANLVKDDGGENNLLLIHFEKIGILELVNSLKSRTDLSEEVLALLNEFSQLFK